MRLIAVILGIFCVLGPASRPGAAAAAAPIQGGYASAPLAEPVYDDAQVLYETMKINRWLEKNIGPTDRDAMKGPREYLYYFIDSQVKHVYARSGRVLPEKPDPTLATLFGWAERLHVYGGRLVYNAVRLPEMPPAREHLPLPESYKLALKGDTLVLSDSGGRWSLTVPYYFMIWGLLGPRTPDGVPLQHAVISTGTHRDRGALGFSQATLAFTYGPEADADFFETRMAAAYGFNDATTAVELPGSRLKSRIRYDAESRIHFEYVTWPASQGQVLVVYSGLDGTYQWNRPHFLDFLKHIEVR